VVSVHLSRKLSSSPIRNDVFTQNSLKFPNVNIVLCAHSRGKRFRVRNVIQSV
jgi:hypothetical protein